MRRSLAAGLALLAAGPACTAPARETSAALMVTRPAARGESRWAGRGDSRPAGLVGEVRMSVAIVPEAVARKVQETVADIGKIAVALYAADGATLGKDVSPPAPQAGGGIGGTVTFPAVPAGMATVFVSVFAKNGSKLLEGSKTVDVLPFTTAYLTVTLDMMLPPTAVEDLLAAPPLPTTVATASSGGKLFEVQTASLSAVPSGIAVDVAGRMWVALEAPGELLHLDGAFFELGSHGVGASASAVTASAGGDAWAVSAGTGLVTQVSPAGTVVATASVGGVPGAIWRDPSGNLFLTDTSAGTLTRITGDGHVQLPLALGAGARGVVVGPGDIWVAGPAGKLAKVGFDGSFSLFASGGSKPCCVAVSPQNQIWVANSGDDTISLLNPIGQIAFTVPAPPGVAAIGLGPDGTVWAAGASPPALRGLSPDGSKVYEIGLPLVPRALVIGASGAVYLAGSGKADASAGLLTRITPQAD